MSVWCFELLGLWERCTATATGIVISDRGTSIGANKPLNHSHHNLLRLQDRALILTRYTTQALAETHRDE